jgi:hypothetical protein
VGNFIHGDRSAATFADTNADGIPEMLIGIRSGGVRWHQGISTGMANLTVSDDVSSFPNPAKVNSSVSLQGNNAQNLLCAKEAHWISRDGRSLRAQQMGTGGVRAPSTPGWYVLVVTPCANQVAQELLKIPMVILP